MKAFIWGMGDIEVKKRIAALIFFMFGGLFLQGCSDRTGTEDVIVTDNAPVEELADSDPSKHYLQTPSKVDMVVYKSPTCGCCADWIEHINDQGFSTRIEHPAIMSEVKLAWKIPTDLQSCHTAVSRQGYVFEGHIPAHVIQRFLAEKPRKAYGLTVPDMPVGSPGMEMGDRFEPYNVYLLREDGKKIVFTHIGEPR